MFILMCDDMWPERSIKDIMPKFIEFMDNEQADCLRIHEKLHWWGYAILNLPINLLKIIEYLKCNKILYGY